MGIGRCGAAFVILGIFAIQQAHGSGVQGVVAGVRASWSDGGVAEQASAQAVAAALQAALSRQLDAKSITVEVDSHAIEAGDAGVRRVHGGGRVRIDSAAAATGAAPDWRDFDYRVDYDGRTAACPVIRLSDDAQEQASANDAGLIAALEQALIEAMAGGGLERQQMRLRWDTIHSYRRGSDHLRINACGLLDSGVGRGALPIQVDALYDRRGQRWLRLDHLLPAAAAPDAASPPADRP